MSVIDQGGAVRRGEELDIESIEYWLKQIDPGIRGDAEVTQFSGGASNWTYRLKYNNRDFILRRPPKGTKADGAHDMAREFHVQKRLKPFWSAVPTMVALCQDQSVLGCDFYVMERISGIIPRANLPVELNLSPAKIRRLCLNALDQLIELHNVDYQLAGLESFGKGPGYCERQVTGWDSRYEKSRTWNVPKFSKVREWLKANIPTDSQTCLIHNDWRFDNLVLSPDRPTEIVGVLDWELATLGDPLMDVGNMLAYWVEPQDNFIFRAARRQPTHLSGMLKREEVVNYYLEKTGRSADNWLFYEVFGLFRLAGIVQQIYYRYLHRETLNPEFKHFWLMVHALHFRCLHLIRKSKKRSMV